jgi:hypothetical protein
MGVCKLDHSRQDVLNKLEQQQEHLPEDMYRSFASYLEKERPQLELNEAFHLLKKYDLSSEEEQQERNKKMQELLQKN